jgi:hypothetical protein
MVVSSCVHGFCGFIIHGFAGFRKKFRAVLVDGPDGGGNFGQQVPGGGVDHLAQQVDGLRAAEGVQGVEILRIEDGVVAQSQPVQQQIGHAVFHQLLEFFLLHGQLGFLQCRPICGDDGGCVPLRRLEGRHGQHRLRHGEFSAEHLQQRLRVAVFHGPKRHRLGVLCGPGVLNVEVIFHPGPALTAPKDGNSCGAAADAPPEAAIPLVKFQHGNGVGPLVVDQKLVLERVAVVPPGALQKGQPVFWGSGDCIQRLLVKLEQRVLRQ